MSRGACFNRIGQVIRAAGSLGVGRAAGEAGVERKGDPARGEGGGSGGGKRKCKGLPVSLPAPGLPVDQCDGCWGPAGDGAEKQEMATHHRGLRAMVIGVCI